MQHKPNTSRPISVLMNTFNNHFGLIINLQAYWSASCRFGAVLDKFVVSFYVQIYPPWSGVCNSSCNSFFFSFIFILFFLGYCACWSSNFAASRLIEWKKNVKKIYYWLSEKKLKLCQWFLYALKEIFFLDIYLFFLRSIYADVISWWTNNAP